MLRSHLFVFLLLPLTAVSQIPWPRHGLVLRYSHGFEPNNILTANNDGDRVQYTVSFRSLTAQYQWRTGNNFGLLFMADLSMCRYGYKASVSNSTGDATLGDPIERSFQFSWPGGGQDIIPFNRSVFPLLSVGGSHTMAVSRRWGLELSALAGIMPLSNTTTTYHFNDQISSENTNTLVDASIRYGFQNYLIISGAAQLCYHLPSLDRISLGVQFDRSIGTFYATSVDVLPGSPSERSMSRDLPLFRVRASIAYTFTWGKPRVPRWYRRSLEKSASPVE